MRMTGLGDHVDGLYKLKVSQLDAHVNTLYSSKHISSFNNDALWHYRLGHVSVKGLQTLHV